MVSTIEEDNAGTLSVADGTPAAEPLPPTDVLRSNDNQEPPPTADAKEEPSSQDTLEKAKDANHDPVECAQNIPVNGNSMSKVLDSTMVNVGETKDTMAPSNQSDDIETAAVAKLENNVTSSATVEISSAVEEKQLSSSSPEKDIQLPDATAPITEEEAVLTPPTIPATENTSKGIIPTTTVIQRPKVSAKSPRKENDWLRSPTSIGDGYSKIVSDIGKLRQMLQQNSTDSGSSADSDTAPGTAAMDVEKANAPSATAALSPVGNSVIEKLGKWINGARSPSSHTAADTTKDKEATTIHAVKQSDEKSQQQPQQDAKNEETQVQQRMEIIEQHAKSLMTSQLTGFLNTNYNLPQLVANELDLIKSQLDSTTLTNGQSKLTRAKEMYESIKSFSFKVASHLEQEIQKFTENRKLKVTEGEGPPLSISSSWTGEGAFEQLSNTATAAAAAGASTAREVQQKKRKRVGAKCLTKVRQSWEMATANAAAGTRNSRRGVQFLSSSVTSRSSRSGGTKVNFRNRETHDKSLSEIIANVPDDATNESNGILLKKKDPQLSYESINGIIPTMAPSMLDGQPAVPPDYAAAFGRNKKRKRGTKDGKGCTANRRGSASNSKNKRSRRSNDGSMSGTPSSVGGAATSLSSKRDSANLQVRVLPDMTPKPKVAFVEGDQNPNRLCNPLLRLPQFPDGLDPPIEEIPQGGELWNLADLHWAEPDTYPISYLARLLGFDVPEEGVNEPFAKDFDPATVKMMKDDSDPWSCMPSRGSFSDRVWKKPESLEGNGKSDDLNLSYCDPLWANIISSYRGFNDSDFKDAGKGFADNLSTDCLKFAYERGVLSKEKGISFRFGTPNDLELLQPLAYKCSWKSHRRHDIATSLRGHSSFCIIAESTTAGAIAFLQYSFCWYKVEEKISAATGAEKVSELVLFLDALVHDPDMSASVEGNDDLECAKTLLTSFALVHAARANIWYGMVDSPESSVHFFAKYFRMSTIGRSTNEIVPLVFDLKKCHFRYAILLLEETLNMKKCSPDLKDQVSGDRMIVRFHTNASDLRCNVSSASKDLRSNKTHVRLVKNEDKSEIFSVSDSAENGESLSVIDPNLIDVNVPQWNILRLFPITEQKPPSLPDGFSSELERKQKELEKLEASIEVTARGLLTKAYDEVSEFHKNGISAKKKQQEDTLAEYAEVQRRLHEADLAWQAQLDQDMDAVCDICFDGEVTPENQIIFCDTCNVAVHQGCYGIEKVPSGNYFCRACTHFGIDKEFIAAERRRGPRTKPTRPPINCELCPRRHGAFVLADSPTSTSCEPCDKPKKAKWVHVSCAKWHGMNYVDFTTKDKIEDLSGLKSWFKGSGHKCCLCDSGVGAMHQCRHEGCNEWLHLTCGRSIGTCSVQHGENCFGFYDETKLKYPPWTLACPKHSEVDPESIREDSLTVDQLVTIAKSYPPEPVPPKPFYKMNGTERKEFWADKDNLKKFFGKVMTNLSGAKCDVCELAHDPNDKNEANRFCPKCGVFSHAECADPARGEDGICRRCRFIEENKNSGESVDPQCHMCNTSTLAGGPIVKTFANPLTMKKWKSRKDPAFKRSLYGPNNFCHAICGL